jgi:activator of HSP90 ATPase
MSQRNIPSTLTNTATRRQLIAGVAIFFGNLAVRPSVFARAQEPAMKEPPSSPANHSRTSLHNEVEIKAAPQRIYDAILDSKQFAAFSGLPATIDAKEGGAFSIFSGQIVGRNVELIPAQRIVQAWRPAHWDAGIYSIARFELKPQGSGTMLVLDHTSFPEGDYDHLTYGWKLHYWEPLKKYFA